MRESNTLERHPRGVGSGLSSKRSSWRLTHKCAFSMLLFIHPKTKFSSLPEILLHQPRASRLFCWNRSHAFPWNLGPLLRTNICVVHAMLVRRMGTGLYPKSSRTVLSCRAPTVCLVENRMSTQIGI